jgi:hypothetical protein
VISTLFGGQVEPPEFKPQQILIAPTIEAPFYQVPGFEMGVQLRLLRPFFSVHMPSRFEVMGRDSGWYVRR